MNRYSERSPCPKCGSPFVRTRLDNDRYCGERLRRTCSRCGYAWNELPLDAAVPQGGDEKEGTRG